MKPIIVNQEAKIVKGVLEGIKGKIVGFDIRTHLVEMELDEDTLVCVHSDIISQEEEQEQPYLTETKVVAERKYNSTYGNDRICECGHPYYRHFDTYEDMEACGCKYCSCYVFNEKKES